MVEHRADLPRVWLELRGGGRAGKQEWSGADQPAVRGRHVQRSPGRAHAQASLQGCNSAQGGTWPSRKMRLKAVDTPRALPLIQGSTWSTLQVQGGGVGKPSWDSLQLRRREGASRLGLRRRCNNAPAPPSVPHNPSSWTLLVLVHPLLESFSPAHRASAKPSVPPAQCTHASYTSSISSSTSPILLARLSQ